MFQGEGRKTSSGGKQIFDVEARFHPSALCALRRALTGRVQLISHSAACNARNQSYFLTRSALQQVDRGSLESQLYLKGHKKAVMTPSICSLNKKNSVID